MRRKVIFISKHFGQLASASWPVGVVDGGAARQPRCPPAVRARRHDNVIAGGDDSEVMAARTRSHVRHVDAMRQRHLEVDEVPATPVGFDAGDDELNATESIDEIPHRVREVSIVGRLVAEPYLVGVQYVAAPYVDTHSHVDSPARRPRGPAELVDELSNFREECEMFA